MVRMRCGMGVSDALTLWKWRITFVVEWTLLLENRMESLFTECVTCLIVTSCDVDSIDKLVCERKWSVDSVIFSCSPPITWVWERNHANLLSLDFLIPIHSTSLQYHLHRLALEFHNYNHHHSLSFSSNCNPYSIHCLKPINETYSNSSLWFLFNRILLLCQLATYILLHSFHYSLILSSLFFAFTYLTPINSSSSLIAFTLMNDIPFLIIYIPSLILPHVQSNILLLNKHRDRSLIQSFLFRRTRRCLGRKGEGLRSGKIICNQRTNRKSGNTTHIRILLALTDWKTERKRIASTQTRLHSEVGIGCIQWLRIRSVLRVQPLHSQKVSSRQCRSKDPPRHRCGSTGSTRGPDPAWRQ